MDGLETRFKLKCAFQGERCACSEDADLQFFAERPVEPDPCLTFEHVFAAVQSGQCEFGSVAMIREPGLRDSAAIASARAAEPPGSNALNHLQEITSFLKVLGTCPRGERG